MSKLKNGELIVLYVDGGADSYFVKGHVSESDFISELESELGEDTPDIAATEHKYAFWGVGQHPDTGEPCQVFYERDKPGRGRFKVTEGYVRDGWIWKNKQESA